MGGARGGGPRFRGRTKMRRYGQFCPVAKAAEVFCERWTPLVIRDLHWGATRFSELRRGVPLMSPTLLSRRLKSLEAEGIVERRPAPDGRGHTYHLTAAGLEFAPLIDALGVWGQRWTRRDLADGEVDLDLLVWAIERSVNAEAFGTRRSLVRIEFTDAPRNKRLWWFLNEDAHCVLCVDDPGFETDLYLAATVADMTRVIRGDLKLARALDDGRLEALGTAAARAALAGWLNLSPLAAVAPAEPPVTAGSPAD